MAQFCVLTFLYVTVLALMILDSDRLPRQVILPRAITRQFCASAFNTTSAQLHTIRFLQKSSISTGPEANITPETVKEHTLTFPLATNVPAIGPRSFHLICLERTYTGVPSLSGGP